LGDPYRITPSKNSPPKEGRGGLRGGAEDALSLKVFLKGA